MSDLEGILVVALEQAVAAARLGLDAEELMQRFPRLVYFSLSGYGEGGPYRNHKADDLLIQGESGLLAIKGAPEQSARVGISVCEIAAGETAHGAIMRSLYARERTGKGRAIEVSLFPTARRLDERALFAGALRWQAAPAHGVEASDDRPPTATSFAPMASR